MYLALLSRIHGNIGNGRPIGADCVHTDDGTDSPDLVVEGATCVFAPIGADCADTGDCAGSPGLEVGGAIQIFTPIGADSVDTGDCAVGWIEIPKILFSYVSQVVLDV